MFGIQPLLKRLATKAEQRDEAMLIELRKISCALEEEIAEKGATE